MNNLLLCMFPTLLICVGLLIAVIIMFVKHTKRTTILSLIFTIFIIILVCFCIPHFKDAYKKETVTIYGTYTGHISSGLITCAKLSFDCDGIVKDVYVSEFIFSKYNLEENKSYKISYYKNSNVIYSLELID